MKTNHPHPDDPLATRPAAGNHYQIRVQGSLSTRWADWFNGLDMTPLPNGETLLAGLVADQPALHGLLARIRDLNLELISVERVERPG